MEQTECSFHMGFVFRRGNLLGADDEEGDRYWDLNGFAEEMDEQISFLKLAY